MPPSPWAHSTDGDLVWLEAERVAVSLDVLALLDALSLLRGELRGGPLESLFGSVLREALGR